MQSTFLLMVAAALFGSGMAVAQSVMVNAPENKQPKSIAKFEEQFRAADKDGDGALTKVEAENGNMQRIVEHFDRIDINKDGKATRDEIRSLIRSRLSI